MNKSKITKINLHTSNGPKPLVPSTSLPAASSNPLPAIPMSTKSIEFERYDFTTPLNTMELKKCKDLASISSSNDYSIEFPNSKLTAGKFKSGRENKKSYLSSGRDANCNDKSASEFASYTEPSKMPNLTEQQMCLPASLSTNSSSDVSSSDSVQRENGVPNRRSSKGKPMVQRKKVVHHKPKNHSSSMPSALCSASKMAAAWPPLQCPLGHQRCLAKKQEHQMTPNNQFKLTDKCEFLFFCIGTSINLGNLWRFPYLCLSHEGGSLLVAYFIACILIGFPLLLIELTLGQYTKMNSIHLFKNIAPIFKGFGNVTMLVSFVTTIYLNLVLSWALIYIVESFRGMRFKKCDPTYSSLNCINLDSASTRYNMINRSSIVLSSEDFFNNQILSKPLADAQLTKINWTVLLALIVTWSILFAFLSLNVRHTGRLVYFVATFPYFVLFLVFLKCITLNNAVDGLIFYVVPNLNKLKDPELWKDAVVQVFYSFGLVSGTILTYASQNKFYSPVLNHATLVWSINLLTSLFVCFSIFSILGFYASILGRPVNSVLSSGVGLLFIVIPDRLAGSMSWPILWTSFYFFVLLIIGLNSQLASLEVICSFLDNFLGTKRRSRTPVLRYFGLCLVLFICSVPFATGSGAYLMEMTDYYFNGLVYLCIALMEFILVSYVFGMSHFFGCLRQMRCWTPKLLVKSHLTVLLTTICPLILAYLINISLQQILNLREKSLFKYSDRLSEIFYYALCFFIGLNLFLVLFGCFHFIFIQELEKKLISTGNRKLSVWIKIRFGLEATSSFCRNANQNIIKSMKGANRNQPKYLVTGKKHHQANCNLHAFKSKMVKNKDSIIVF